LSQTGDEIECVGLEELIETVVKVWLLSSTLATRTRSSHNDDDDDDDLPVISVLGFSQGTVFAHVLASLTNRKVEPFDRIQKFVLICGFPATTPQLACTTTRYREKL
jgi:pimeloyl-ACP methyl ester carboxylesterase